MLLGEILSFQGTFYPSRGTSIHLGESLFTYGKVYPLKGKIIHLGEKLYRFRGTNSFYLKKILRFFYSFNIFKKTNILIRYRKYLMTRDL